MSLHGSPTSAELLEAVREWIENELVPVTEGRTRFHARVAANVLAMVEREIQLGDEQRVAHAARLGALGVADDAELARSIRDGSFDDRLAEVRAALAADVADRLAVANPTYVDD